MKRKSLFSPWIWIVTIIAQNICFSQTVVEDSSQTNPLVGAIKTVGSDVAYVFTSPSRLSKKAGLQLLALSAITAGFILKADGEVDEELALEDYEFSSQPFRKLASLGQVYDNMKPLNFAIGLTATTLAGGLMLGDKKLLQTSRLLVESVVLTKLFTSWSKGVIGRSRPYTGNGPTDFDLFKFRKAQAFRSMPSGHVSSAFALMTVIAKQYDHWWVDVPAYTFAASVAFQRMTSRNHWASDTIIGGALGYWVGSMLVKKQRQRPKGASLNLYPIGNRLGVAVSF